MNISPLAYVHPEAQIGEGCKIGPFCYIDKGVVIGDNNELMNSVTLLSGTTIGNENVIFPGAVIGAIPQDLKFRGEDSTVVIGSGNRIRENVTIHRGTASKGTTIVGNNNLIMENAHIAHDCVFGNGIIMGNSTKLAGEVIVDDNAIISAVVLVHQFCRIGGYTMVQGGTRTSMDIPPFVIAAREPVAYCGLNIVGLRRRNFSVEVINDIHNAYRILYNSNLRTADALQQIRETITMGKEVQYIVDFVANSTRGIIR
ncbi:MAG: acyl-ACP--UDP-N-acetylglucosamine O-acyltransferase [Bacteroidaceae bacterium]|nr:acyl-ACP--UDP-N-acetylglucosamine O-acyltransferase [Bacteroidaceae bacterium]MBQ8675192.1 acyl-ACP--UDP-N-acetylglucosamine O-acyltransferase [Bacteroidaceae bacterium]MBQ9176349.1 acyl-ACP--UDP-N-acetylglucosamine O-acyltransferase [Bacteroidaceae bacterium]